jgi:hypothetical protein
MRSLPTVPEEKEDLEQGFLVAQKGVGADAEGFAPAPAGCDRCLVASYCIGVPLCLGLGVGVILLFWWLIGDKP